MLSNSSIHKIESSNNIIIWAICTLHICPVFIYIYNMQCAVLCISMFIHLFSIMSFTDCIDYCLLGHHAVFYYQWDSTREARIPNGRRRKNGCWIYIFHNNKRIRPRNCAHSSLNDNYTTSQQGQRQPVSPFSLYLKPMK